ncbi:glycerate kinase [Sulfuritortus calidifontis]|uniref:Glycerate kinase n=1 Tax=Sulfuritortus calidifontis TaxID=1914471 RepID=A0A4R3JUX2_9PROT|nr:glycerate kinase [Sulfuritortus calidifontis]TCS71686.1 glycerate kinase [Sulfuritortus calidifontis]
MPTLVLAPDAFKGCLSAPAVAEAMASGFKRVWPDARILARPMADGGEGTLDAVLAASAGRRLTARVQGADGRPIEVPYGLVHGADGPTAVLEAAAVVGLPMAGAEPVASRSTVGLGQLLRHCLEAGHTRFLIGLGGSSTNDGGSGLLAALGVRLLDAHGHTVAPTPAGLADLARVDFSGLDPRLKQCRLTLMTDVQNPLCGPLGATAVFGPQKGVAPDAIGLVDARLRHWAELGDAWAGAAISERPGAGSAGGLGYALQLLGASHRAGAEVVAELAGLDAALQGADWAITGEGRSDAQTLLGKVPLVVARHARAAGVPVSLLSGAFERAALAELAPHFDGCFALPDGPMPLEAALAGAHGLLADRAEQLARVLAACGKLSRT